MWENLENIFQSVRVPCCFVDLQTSVTYVSNTCMGWSCTRHPAMENLILSVVILALD